MGTLGELLAGIYNEMLHEVGVCQRGLYKEASCERVGTILTFVIYAHTVVSHDTS